MSTEHELQPSDEVDDRQLALAREAGETYREAATYMIEEVAETGALTETGDYLVGFAQEEAEGLYRPEGDGLTWNEPAEAENCHLEVIVASAADGRFLPGLSVSATLDRESDDATVGPVEIPFLWHPGLYHYGRNLELPGEGSYTITIEADPPNYARHDEQNGDRFTDPIEVRFEAVDVETGSDS